jgi:hypothetical protein
VFLEHLQEVIESATARLLAEGERQLGAANHNRRDGASDAPSATAGPEHDPGNHDPRP